MPWPVEFTPTHLESSNGRRLAFTPHRRSLVSSPATTIDRPPRRRNAGGRAPLAPQYWTCRSPHVRMSFRPSQPPETLGASRTASGPRSLACASSHAFLIVAPLGRIASLLRVVVRHRNPPARIVADGRSRVRGRPCRADRIHRHFSHRRKAPRRCSRSGGAKDTEGNPALGCGVRIGSRGAAIAPGKSTIGARTDAVAWCRSPIPPHRVMATWNGHRPSMVISASQAEEASPVAIGP